MLDWFVLMASLEKQSCFLFQMGCVFFSLLKKNLCWHFATTSNWSQNDKNNSSQYIEGAEQHHGSVQPNSPVSCPHVEWMNVCHFKDNSPVGASSSGTTRTRQTHKQADTLTVGTANFCHQLMLLSASPCLPACLSVCCSKACVMMNELPSVKRKAPLFKVTALSELSHFGELPSYPSRRAGHTCPCTFTYPHTLTCTFADKPPESLDPSHPILTQTFTDTNVFTHRMQADIISRKWATFRGFG